MNDDMNQILLDLSSQGCYPCISRRGAKTWRAHINSGGNWWADARSPSAALRRAHKDWIQARKPMDGLADIVGKSK